MGAAGGAGTPVIMGRWQTRVVLLAILGSIVAAIFAGARSDEGFFIVLGYVVLFGIGWDVLYIGLQRVRWDRDWPTSFQLAAGIAEGVMVFLLLEFVGLPGIDKGAVGIGIFAAHYGVTWLVVFLWSQGPMRLTTPYWRYNGGRLV